MTDIQDYLLSAVFFLLLCALFYLWKFYRKKHSESGQRKFLVDTLDLARSRFETFSLKSRAPGKPRKGVSAMLKEIGKNELVMDAGDFVPTDLSGKPVDVFFSVEREEGPVFYAFSSIIKSVESDFENSRLVLSLPQNLRVEKKRRFLRLRPKKNEVRVVGLWPMKPGGHLPNSMRDLGEPLARRHPGDADDPVIVDDISAAGLALRFQLDESGEPIIPVAKGDHILCLAVYEPVTAEESGPGAFWCAAEAMNSRLAEGVKPALVVGLEFTNWAPVEKGVRDIHWSHCSPSRGARPIERWVGLMEKKRRGQD